MRRGQGLPPGAGDLGDAGTSGSGSLFFVRRTFRGTPGEGELILGREEGRSGTAAQHTAGEPRGLRTGTPARECLSWPLVLDKHSRICNFCRWAAKRGS